MKHGSLQNLLADNSIQAREAAPKVGDGITEVSWTDRHAGTIKRVAPNGKKFWYTMDDAKRTDKNGMSDCQSYSYTTTDLPEADWNVATLRKDGKWHQGTTLSGRTIMVGVRDEYHDFSF